MLFLHEVPAQKTNFQILFLDFYAFLRCIFSHITDIYWNYRTKVNNAVKHEWNMELQPASMVSYMGKWGIMTLVKINFIHKIFFSQ